MIKRAAVIIVFVTLLIILPLKGEVVLESLDIGDSAEGLSVEALYMGLSLIHISEPTRPY